jgi:soluble lytic murein transglycosylase-like protein
MPSPKHFARGSLITIYPNPAADPTKPWHEWHAKSQVAENERHIGEMAQKYRLDPDLIRAIMYMETTHGWYDALAAPVDWNESIRPMNIHAVKWQGFGYSRKDLKDSRTNIEAGARILKGIISILKDPSVENVATLYNHLGATQVTTYGARVRAIYHRKLWLGN